MKKVSKATLLRRAHVDRMTLHMYLSEPFAIKPSTRVRIENAIRELGISRADLQIEREPTWLANARSPRRKRSNNVPTHEGN